MRKPDKGVLLITHYQRLLDYVRPDFVHVLVEGPHRQERRARARAPARKRRLRGGDGVNALALPTSRDEAWRYAEFAALATLAPERSARESDRACRRADARALLVLERVGA